MTHFPDVVIQVNVLEAALENLNLTDITAAQLITAVKKEERTLGPEWKNAERQCFCSFFFFFLCEIYSLRGLYPIIDFTWCGHYILGPCAL